MQRWATGALLGRGRSTHVVSRRGEEGTGLRSPGTMPAKSSMAGQESCRCTRQGSMDGAKRIG